MPRVKKILGVGELASGITTEVNSTTNSTDPETKVEFAGPIAPLNLDLGREDLNRLVAKVNEIIKKVNL